MKTPTETLDHLLSMIDRALDETRRLRDNEFLAANVRFEAIGANEALWKLRDQIVKMKLEEIAGGTDR